jgi:hypothetical protein
LSYGKGKDGFMSYGVMSLPNQPGMGMSLIYPGMSFPYQQGFSLYYSNQQRTTSDSLSTPLSPSLLISKVPLEGKNPDITFRNDVLTEFQRLNYTMDSCIHVLLDVDFQEDDSVFKESMAMLQDTIVSQAASYFPLFSHVERPISLITNLTASGDERYVTGLDVNISLMPFQPIECKVIGELCS